MMISALAGRTDPLIDVRPLADLATATPDVAPLAQAWARALRASGESDWADSPAELVNRPAGGDVPLLHNAVLTVDPAHVKELLCQTTSDLSSIHEAVQPIGRAVRDGNLDPITILHGAITSDTQRLESAAQQAGLDAERLQIVAQIAALPLLVSWGRQASSAAESWRAGYCPVCGAWPSLAEMRGLDREHWLRCGQCSSGWQYSSMRCVFCGQEDHERLGYLAADAERESRRATTCEACHGYLKTFATLAALTPAEILARDLTSVDLDMAALEFDYGRPEGPGHRLELRIEPRRKRSGWLGWRS